MRRCAAVLAALLSLAAAGLAQAVSQTRTSAYVYDANGQLAREIVEPFDAKLCLVSVHTYDAYGNRATENQRNCNGTEIPGVGTEAPAPAAGDTAVFSIGGLTRQTTYASVAGVVERTVTTVNALGHQTIVVTEPRTGGIKSSTDAGNLVTRYRYDGLGRQTLEQRPDGNGTRWIYEHCNGQNGGAAGCTGVRNAFAELVYPAYVITSYAVAGANVDTGAGSKDGPYTKTYYDVRKRVLRVEREGWDGSGTPRLIYEDTAYDMRGRLDMKSQPYFYGSETPKWSFYEFDITGRLTSESRPGMGTIESTYAGLTTTRATNVLDEPTRYSTQITQRTTERRNALGQITAIEDTEGKTLSRSYSPWGDLQATVDPAGNSVRMEYDLRGRKTKLIDPDLGTWSYEYDALSRLVKQTDAKGQVSTFEYDVLGRLKRRLEADHESRWSYDSQYADGSACANAKGLLCEAQTLTGTGAVSTSRRLAYDGLARITSATTRAEVAGATGVYQAEVSYNGRGQIATRTYPGPAGQRLSVSHDYTGLGFLQRVKDAGTGYVYWSAQEYDARWQLTQQSYGNGVVTTRQYDAAGRLTTAAAGAGNAVQNVSYSYDRIGNLRSRTETRADAIFTFDYDYDNRNRLKTEARSGGAITGTQSIGWSYDDIGNITSRSDVGTYAYPAAGGARPHAVSSVTGTVNGVANPAYTYDANGNMLASAGRTATWTSFNLPATLARGANELSWAYDSEHERVREQLRVNGVLTRTTVYVNPGAGAGLYYEEEVANGVLRRRHYISGGDGTVALLTRQAGVADELRYWHKDHLGSTQVVTGESGAVIERMAYEPFGKRRQADGTTDAAGTLTALSTDRGFTEHEMLDEVGLIHMNGRIYDPAIGRFLSADPNVPYARDLQSYNRYSYTRNNPLSLVDPTGFEDDGLWDDFWSDWFGGGDADGTAGVDAPSICESGCGEDTFNLDAHAYHELQTEANGEQQYHLVIRGNAGAGDGDSGGATLASTMAIGLRSPTAARLGAYIPRVAVAEVVETLTTLGLRSVLVPVGLMVVPGNAGQGNENGPRPGELGWMESRAAGSTDAAAGEALSASAPAASGANTANAPGQAASAPEASASSPTEPAQPNENDLDKIKGNKAADEAARQAGYDDAHDAKKGRGDSRMNIYNDRTTGQKWLWDGKKGSWKDQL